MVAIAGCIGAAGAPTDAHCARLLASLTAYGQSQPELIAYRRAAFGCVADIQAAAHLASQGGRLFVGDVRLDNRNEIAAALGIAAGGSDINLVAAAWMKWGDSCLDRLVGDFAFAVWDPMSAELLLCRDATGERPLFFRIDQHVAQFASMPAALADPGEFQVDRLAATMLGYPDASVATNFRNVSRVLPGSIVSILAGEVKSRRYWAPPQNRLRLRDDEYVEAYRAFLFEAVGCRTLRAGGNLGTHLSSGWDSCAVTATAASLNLQPIAFTAAPLLGHVWPSPRGRQADESGLAAEVAAFHHLEHHVIRPRGSPLEKLRAHSRLYQEPNRNIVNMQWWSATLAAAKERGVSIMLTGQMGNLSLHAGGLGALAEWIRAGSPFRWLKEARAAHRHSPASWRGIVYNSFGPWVPSQMLTLAERSAGLVQAPYENPFVRREWRGAGEAYAARSKPLVRGGPYAARLEAVRASDAGQFRLGSLGESGIEERDPLADRRIIEFSFRLPPDQLIRDGQWRPMARRALVGLFPPSIRDNPLRGYQGADWFNRIAIKELHDIADDLSGSSAAANLLDWAAIRSAIDRWPVNGPKSPRETQFFRTNLLLALSTGAFLQEFEQKPA